MTMTQRQLIGSIGGHTSWARTPDRTARTSNGRQAFMERFEREVDPDGVLPADERARRAENAKSAYFKSLARRSANVRKRREAANLDELLAGMRNGRKPPKGQRWFDAGCCICGRQAGLVRDHCHATGVERGTLCRSCNTTEGKRSDHDDFGLWALWRSTAPGLAIGELYVPAVVQRWLYDAGLKVVPVDEARS